MKKLAVILCLLVGLLFSSNAFGVGLWMIDYDSSSSKLVGVTIELGATYVNPKFVSINPSTGLLTVINSNLGSAASGWHGVLKSVRGSCIDSANHIFYVILNDNDGNGYVVQINTSTGVVTTSPALHY